MAAWLKQQTLKVQSPIKYWRVNYVVVLAGGKSLEMLVVSCIFCFPEAIYHAQVL